MPLGGGGVSMPGGGGGGGVKMLGVEGESVCAHAHNPVMIRSSRFC